jgi:glucose-1-phosphate thymidylyltransferase
MMANRIGLFPAAGSATRLGRMNSSKEVLSVVDVSRPTPGFCPVGEYLLRHFEQAALSQALVITRTDKRDIVETLGFRFGSSMRIEYHMCATTPSAVHTIDAAAQRLGDSDVALGFPDIIMHASDVYERLFQRLDSTDAAVVLGLFPTSRPDKFDMVATNDNHDVLRIDIKNPQSPLRETWVCAVWSAEFTRFMHTWVSTKALNAEPHVGHVFQAAIKAELRVSTVRFPKGRILDVGTPEDLSLARDTSALVEFLKVHTGI